MSAELAALPWPVLVASLVTMTLVAIVGVTIRAILKGALVPRQHLVDVQAERDKWEAAWKLSQQAMSEFDGRLEANTEALRFMQQLVNSLATKGPVP